MKRRSRWDGAGQQRAAADGADAAAEPVIRCADRMLTDLAYNVLDMNQLRDEAVVGECVADFQASGTGILLPAHAIYELSKGTASGMTASLALLSLAPDAVTIARPSIILKRLEKESRRPCVDVVDRRYTDNVREVLSKLPTHDIDPVTVDAVRAHWRRILDREQHARALRQLQDIDRRDVDQATANAVRRSLPGNPPKRELLIDALIDVLGGLVGIAQFLVTVGYKLNVATRLTREGSFSALHLIAYRAFSLRFRIEGGLSGRKDTTLENDGLDLEYVLFGLRCKGLRSADARAVDAFVVARAAAERLGIA
jgi:hypothetical protein